MIDPTYTFQPSAAETYLNQSAPNGTDGAETLLYVENGSGYRLRSLLKFDTSSQIPQAATINSATLSLYFYGLQGSDPHGRTYWAYRITQTGWVETQATWNSYKSGSAWTAAGGDYTATNGASVVMPSSFGWVNWTVTAQVQTAVTSVSGVAHFLIKDGTENSGDYGAIFYSRRYSSTTYRPKLYVDWTSITTYTIAHGLDVALRKLNITVAAGSDIVLKRLGLTGEEGIDVLLKRLGVESAFGLDVAVRLLGLTEPLGINAALAKSGLSTDSGIDVVLEKLSVTQAGIDVALKGFGLTGKEGIDVALKRFDLSIDEGIDLLLKKLGLAPVDIDIVLSAAGLLAPVGIDVALQRLRVTHGMGIDMLVGETTAREVGIDLALQRQLSESAGISAALAKVGLTVNEGLDIILRKIGLGPYGIDVAVLLLSQTKPMGITTAIRHLSYTALHGIDIDLLSHDVIAMGIDAALMKQGISEASIDAALKLFGLTRGVGIDAFVSLFNISTDMAIDLILSAAIIAQYGTDIAIRQTIQGSFGIGARITFGPAKVLISLATQTFGPSLSIQSRQAKLRVG